LALAGDMDLIKIGFRIGVRYVSFLNHHPYDAGSFIFRSSDASRSSQSTFAFAIGYMQGQKHGQGHDDDNDDNDNRNFISTFNLDKQSIIKQQQLKQKQEQKQQNELCLVPFNDLDISISTMRAWIQPVNIYTIPKVKKKKKKKKKKLKN
jgi:hypothetical protein